MRCFAVAKKLFTDPFSNGWRVRSSAWPSYSIRDEEQCRDTRFADKVQWREQRSRFSATKRQGGWTAQETEGWRNGLAGGWYCTPPAAALTLQIDVRGGVNGCRLVSVTLIPSSGCGDTNQDPDGVDSRRFAIEDTEEKDERIGRSDEHGQP